MGSWSKKVDEAAYGALAYGAESWSIVDFHTAFLGWAVAAFALIAGSFIDSDLGFHPTILSLGRKNEFSLLSLNRIVGIDVIAVGWGWDWSV